MKVRGPRRAGTDGSGVRYRRARAAPSIDQKNRAADASHGAAIRSCAENHVGDRRPLAVALAPALPGLLVRAVVADDARRVLALHHGVGERLADRVGRVVFPPEVVGQRGQDPC